MIEFENKALSHKYLHIVPILAKPVPIESSVRELSIGAGFTQIGAMLRKLWAKQVDVFLKLKKVRSKK